MNRAQLEASESHQGSFEERFALLVINEAVDAESGFEPRLRLAKLEQKAVRYRVYWPYRCGEKPDELCLGTERLP